MLPYAATAHPDSCLFDLDLPIMFPMCEVRDSEWNASGPVRNPGRDAGYSLFWLGLSSSLLNIESYLFAVPNPMSGLMS
jgi:hypothetical protein